MAFLLQLSIFTATPSLEISQSQTRIQFHLLFPSFRTIRELLFDLDSVWWPRGICLLTRELSEAFKKTLVFTQHLSVTC